MTDPPTPPPQLVGAWWVLDILPTASIPGWARDWLVAGQRGEALTELAGLEVADPEVIDELLPDALADCGIRWQQEDRDRGCAPVMVAFCDIAQRFLDGHIGEQTVVAEVLAIINSDPRSPGHELPLGHVLRAGMVRDLCRQEVSLAPDSH